MPTKSSAIEKTQGRDVFILGAGFSKAIANKMPTMEELGAEVRGVHTPYRVIGIQCFQVVSGLGRAGFGWF